MQGQTKAEALKGVGIGSAIVGAVWMAGAFGEDLLDANTATSIANRAHVEAQTAIIQAMEVRDAQLDALRIEELGLRVEALKGN